MGARPSCYMHVSFDITWCYTSSLIHHFQSFKSQYCNNLQFHACILIVLKDLSSEAESTRKPWRANRFACQ